MKRMKRGQITVFILLGLLIFLFIIFLLVYAAPSLLPMKQSTDVVAVQTYIDSCLESQLAEVISLVSLQGGYYDQPDYTLNYTVDGETYVIYVPYIPYFLMFSQDTAPLKAELEEQLSIGLLESLSNCTDFSKIHYNVSLVSGVVAADVKLTSTSAVAKISLPIEIRHMDSTTSLNKFQIEKKTNLYKLYTIALLLTQQQLFYGNQWCVTCISSIIAEKDISLLKEDLIRDKEYDFLYTIQDNSEEGLIFRFAHGFLYPEQTVAPLLLSIENREATIGYEFYYKIGAYGTNLTYSDDTALFDINPTTGVIQFTPDKMDIGTFIITIQVTDDKNQSAETSFVLEVTDVVSSLLSVEPFPYFTSFVGEEFTYTLNVTSNYTTSFTDDTDLFDIDINTGEIRFTPDSTDVGEHEFTITVTDTVGNFVEQEGYIVVVEK